MFDVDSPEQIETLLTQIEWLDGSDAVYEEVGIVAHIRVADINIDRHGVAARARLLRSLRRPGTCPVNAHPAPKEWVFGAAWSYLHVQPFRWACAYPCWVLHFDKDALADFQKHGFLPPGRNRVR